MVPVVSACAQQAAAPAKPLQIEPNSPAKVSSSAPIPDTSMNGITRAAANAGVRTCLERIEKVSNFIVKNTQSKFVMSLPPADVDRQIASASFEAQLPNKAIAYATMTTAPTTDGGCDALYETVAYWDSSCADIAKKGFPGTKSLGVLQQHIIVLEGNNNLKIFLMPAGPQGCVAIKKEIVY